MFSLKKTVIKSQLFFSHIKSPYSLFKLIIKKIIPKINITTPIIRQIVLIGCPNLVVKANPLKNQPTISAVIEISILSRFFKL